MKVLVEVGLSWAAATCYNLIADMAWVVSFDCTVAVVVDVSNSFAGSNLMVDRDDKLPLSYMLLTERWTKCDSLFSAARLFPFTSQLLFLSPRALLYTHLSNDLCFSRATSSTVFFYLRVLYQIGLLSSFYSPLAPFSSIKLI